MTAARPTPFAAAPLGAAIAMTVAGCDLWADNAPVPQRGAGAAAPAPAVDWPNGPLLEDATDAAGLDFARFEGRTPGPDGEIEGGRFMYEWTGGGVAAVDYDADGRPDLYFTQGRAWGDGNESPDSTPDPGADHRGRLYRNVGGERFADVTAAAGLVVTGFGQGVAAGDYNGDGFADLYVCNAGANRLLRNDGDGTFTDVTAAADLAEDAGSGRAGAWTLSASVADLNADGLPDLYDANYAEGDDLFVRTCPGKGEQMRVCGPWTFAAAADRFLLNMGDGTFADISEEAGVPAGPGAAGPSIGVLAADLDGAAGTETFVAVDLRPNHLLLRETAGAGDGESGDDEAGRRLPRFRQAGWAAGLAAAGPAGTQAYACMGVACGDVDGDGDPDLFVTNYAAQPNTLYRNESAPGAPLFEDGTAPAGLAEPGFDTLGFGAQFLDVDRDGDPDLAYVNGHVDDFTHAGDPFRMRPALFLNDGSGRFREAPPAVAGAFFDTPDIGRGLARLDWDGDGRDELVATHMGGRARLLRNAGGGGSGVGLRVVNAAGDRDAVGATVTVTAPTGAADSGAGAPANPVTRFVTAGDGYAASNERLLNVGLGGAPAGTPVSVSVRWPDGAEESFSGVTAGGRFLLTRGRGAAVPVR